MDGCFANTKALVEVWIRCRHGVERDVGAEKGVGRESRKMVLRRRFWRLRCG